MLYCKQWLSQPRMIVSSIVLCSTYNVERSPVVNGTHPMADRGPTNVRRGVRGLWCVTIAVERRASVVVRRHGPTDFAFLPPWRSSSKKWAQWSSQFLLEDTANIVKFMDILTQLKIVKFSIFLPEELVFQHCTQAKHGEQLTFACSVMTISRMMIYQLLMAVNVKNPIFNILSQYHIGSSWFDAPCNWGMPVLEAKQWI